jgi:tetratricopeptide (TPR) repeat protein
VVLVDVAGFGDPQRTDVHRVAVREALYRLLADAFAGCGVAWDDCDHEDRGDGVMVLVPPSVPKSVLADVLIPRLVAALRSHNQDRGAGEQIRLRLALHAGEVFYDGHGVAGQSVNLAFRLLEAAALKRALASADGSLAVIASAWFYEEVVRHGAGRDLYRRVRVRAKETDTSAWISLPGSRSGPAEPELADDQVPRQLPTNVRTFVGRQEELDRLHDCTTRNGTVVITAIDGTAGIGKTTLALHWAHRVKDDYPDGQLHVNLRGFDAGEPVDAGEVLGGFLQALGVDARSLPAGLDQRAALYRSMLADRRMLVVLDNARSSEHVRPLLPAGQSCLVLVTSRRRLDGLVVREGAQRIALDTLPVEDCVRLLSERDPGLDPGVAAELADLCGRLPLALCIVAARAAGQPRPQWLVDELRDERVRLDGLALGDADVSVRAVFSWSYNILTSEAARLFGMLGVHPGPDISRETCAALVPHARESLAELVAAHLVAEYVPGRFRLHDLVRAYAAEIAGDGLDVAERFLDHYLTTALAADRAVQPCRVGVAREAGEPAFTTYAEGMDWFTGESEVLLRMIAYAADRGFAGHAWRLAWACTTFLRRTGRWRERVVAHRLALTAARRAGDAEGVATASRHLASALARIGAHDDALRYLHDAIDLCTRGEDQTGMFRSWLAGYRLLQAKGEHEAALVHAQRAWELVRETSDALSRADVLNALGKQLHLLGRHDEALPLCERSLRDYLQVGHLEGQADVLNNIGEIEQALGRPDQALSHYQQSIEIDRLLGDRYWEAQVCDHIGNAHRDAGRVEEAVAAWSRSAAILEELRHPDAERMRVKAGSPPR